MKCPYCHHALEPLIISGRHTGAFQCKHCTGTWLQYQTFSGLLPAATQVSPNAPRAPLRPPGPLRAPPTGALLDQAAAPLPTPRTTRARGDRRRVLLGWKRRKSADPRAPRTNPDWDICTYCGKPGPGDGPTCIHCNVERMRCPVCGRFMVGVRKQGVLVDLCLSCQGLWFEKGRLEVLIDRLAHPDAPAGLPGTEQRAPSLLHQLARFLEDTDPGPYGPGVRDTGVMSTLSTAFGSSFQGSKRLLYDVLVFLGDLQSPTSDNRANRNRNKEE